MDNFVLAATAILASMIGFWIGRSVVWWGPKEEEEESEHLDLDGCEIGSPVAGEACMTEENGHKRMKVMPEQGKIYAPAAGKITHLYPMGSALVLQTEFGAEILLQAGTHVDEMCSGYYRCRVMEREVVKKGALLLEYDPVGIANEGASPEVWISVQNEEDFRNVMMSEPGKRKVGEPLIYCA